MDFIFIEELRVKASIGIYPREKAARQRVELSMTFGVPGSASARDHIADTINYAEVVERIQAELAARHFNLIESLGDFVVALLCDDFGAPWAKVRVAKVGVMRDVRRVGVVMQRGLESQAYPSDGALP